MYDSRTFAPKPCLMCPAIFTPLRYNHTYCAECGAFRGRALASRKTCGLMQEGNVEAVKAIFAAMDAKRTAAAERAERAEQRKALRRENKASECPERREAGINGLARALAAIPLSATIGAGCRDIREESQARANTTYGKPATVSSVTCECSRKITVGYPCRCGK